MDGRISLPDSDTSLLHGKVRLNALPKSLPRLQNRVSSQRSPIRCDSRRETPSAESFHTSASRASIFPSMPVPGAQPQGYFHASTRLPDGRLGILVDPGAWTNLAGATVARQIAEAAAGYGHSPSQKTLKQPLAIMGVGDGEQKCHWETCLPIAVQTDDGRVDLHRFEAPTVSGSGAELPALLGLRSMRSQNAVLEMTPGREALVFPGKGGYTIDWAPGARRFPLTCAPRAICFCRATSTAESLKTEVGCRRPAWYSRLAAIRSPQLAPRDVPAPVTLPRPCLQRRNG